MANLAIDDVEALGRSLYGAVVLPDSADYDAVRANWNGIFDRRPALIARCTGQADVVHAVNFAREQGLLTAVRGGGHSYSGKSMCDGGIVIDTSPMRAVEVDPVARTARVAAGTLLGQLDYEAQYHGLATTAGVVSHTGCAGLTLGGGFGRLARLLGMTVDNLLSVDLVTPAGKVLTASESENTDLFWALRGGGGNFGVATAFEYRLHPLDPIVYAGAAAWPLSRARDLLPQWFDWCLTAPRELQMTAVLSPGADGGGMFIVAATWVGDLDKGEDALAPMRSFGAPIFDNFGPQRYVDIQSSGDEGTKHGRLYYSKSGFTGALDKAGAEQIIDAFESRATDYSIIIDLSGGGAVSEVAPDATAFPNRDALLWLAVDHGWDDRAESDARIADMRSGWQKIESLSSGFYTNSEMDASSSQFRSNYGANYARLVDIKNRYDPDNLLRLNANVRPTA